MIDVGPVGRGPSFAWALVAVAVMVFVAFAMIALNRDFHTFDDSIRIAVQADRTPTLERIMETLSFLGSGYVVIPLTVITALVLWHRGDSLAGFFPAMMAGAIIFEAGVKWAVARPRPRGSAYAFPSGHVLTSVVLFGGLVYLFWARPMHPVWRWAGTAVCTLLVLGIAYSRLYLNSHWLTDVLGGIAGGAAYLLAGLTLVRDSNRRSAIPEPDAPPAEPR